jgi:hypothetical protein
MADETGALDEDDLFGLSPPDLSSPLSPKPASAPPRGAPRPAAPPAAVAAAASARPAASAPPAASPLPPPSAVEAASAPVVSVHALAEPIDELLQQVTEQTLRMNHFDAGLKEMAKAVVDVGESTQSALVEVRGLVAQVARPGGVGQSDHWQDHVAERLDSLETRAAQARARQLGLLALATVELLLLLLVVAVQVGWVSFRKKSEEFSFAPPPASAAPAATTAPVLPPSPPPDLSPVKSPKGPKGRPRH